MPGFIVTRGLGPRATVTNLIARGFLPVPAVEVIRGLVRGSRRVKQSFQDVLEELKVSAALIAINGKDIVNPIFNTVRSTYRNESKPNIQVTPKTLEVRQPKISVTAKQVRNKDVDN